MTDPSGAAIAGAEVTATRWQTGQSTRQRSSSSGTYHLVLLAGEYELRVAAPNLADYVHAAIQLSVNQTARHDVEMQVTVGHEMVTVFGNAALVDSGSTAIGNVVTGRQLVDLPLNGRNFTQLGLLQPGVAPMTAGLSEAGGSLRSGQAYAVNGQRPEQNNYLLDGTTNLNRVDGGFAIRTPVDAIQEFRILTQTAAPEFGGTSGATTTVVTKSGGNDLHGTAYEFLRNDVFDARSFYAPKVEALKQNQFGATAGGALRKNRDFLFVFYEGFRNREGVTRSATVPSDLQRGGDFSDLRDPQTGQSIPLINLFTGQPFPGNRLPVQAISQVSSRLLDYYPRANAGQNLFVSTQKLMNRSDQGGARFDHNFREADQMAVHFAQSGSTNENPFSTSGADVPGFPVGEDLNSKRVTLSETHLFNAVTVNTFRAGFFRNVFDTNRPINRTPSRDLGFGYESTLAAAEGPPFIIVNGFASVGNPITGPRDTAQNTYEISNSVSNIRGSHSLKFGAGFHRNQINMTQGIAANGFFVFAPFPVSNAFASFLVGFPVVFFQGGGDFNRGLRNVEFSAFGQDEWRVSSRFTLNYGLRWELNTPFVDIRDRMNSWQPGRQSTVLPNAPMGLLVPGDAGVPRGIAPNYYKGLMPRMGIAWDPTGTGKTSIRAAYGIYFDGFTNGVGGPLQAPLSAVPWTQARQLPAPINLADPWGGQAPFTLDSFPRPTTVLTVENGMRPPYAQNWNLSVQRSFAGAYLLDVRYIGNKGTRLPRMIEANPAIYGAGASAENADRRRPFAGCSSAEGTCDFASVGLISNQTNSTYHAGQLALTRSFRKGLAFLGSYTFSKTIDYSSSFNVAGSAPRLVGGENDLAQNPFDLKAERGPSLFDARHRFTLSGSYEVPMPRFSGQFGNAVLGGWQVNTIANFSSGTPFTVYDSANVSLQGTAPQITGFFSSRPDVVAAPDDGPRTPEQWIQRSAFRRLDPESEAGQFGNAGRNIARADGIANVDVSLLKTVPINEKLRMQIRAECFNVANHANFGIPESDISSPNFGRILVPGSPRLVQFGLKFIF